MESSIGWGQGGVGGGVSLATSASTKLLTGWSPSISWKDLQSIYGWDISFCTDGACVSFLPYILLELKRLSIRSMYASIIGRGDCRWMILE
jgi:hypothetical protein